MSALTEEQARTYMHKLLAAMVRVGGSDLFIATDFPPSIKSHGSMQPLTAQKLNADTTRRLAQALMNDSQHEEFEREMECNFAISIPGVSRFRVNVYVQQQSVSMVIRTIATEIPNFEKLKLPEVLKDVIMNKRGLVLVEASASVPALVGYLLDGFGIYGPHGEKGLALASKDLDECHGHTHTIAWEGQQVAMYHYHATPDFPYTAGCLRGSYKQADVSTISGPRPQRTMNAPGGRPPEGGAATPPGGPADPGGAPPDLNKAAATLGISVDALQSALDAAR